MMINMDCSFSFIVFFFISGCIFRVLNRNSDEDGIVFMPDLTLKAFMPHFGFIFFIYFKVYPSIFLLHYRFCAG